jgi:hypothetical protein
MPALGIRSPSLIVQGRVQYLSAGQIEEDVDPLGAVLLQGALERPGRSVVECGIEAELIDQVAHLLVGAGHADHGQAQSLCQLRRDHASRARRGGDK